MWMFSRQVSLAVVKLSSAQRGFTTTVTGPWNYVAGVRCQPQRSSQPLIMVREPATGEELCSVTPSTAGDVHDAVQAAYNAFGAWAKMPAQERGAILTRAAHIIRDHFEDIAKLEVRDTGKPIWEARVDINSCADSLEYFGGLATSITAETVPCSGGGHATVSREPLGVVAGIGAWNFPMQTATWKVAPALACGNTFVYKPSQFSPVTAVTLAEVLSESGLPPNVYNVVQGEGEAGTALCKHPLVAKVSFTGSVPTGRKVYAAVTEGFKNVTLELGGKSPLIIFADADLTNSVKGAMMANFLSQGQVCSNGTRVFVHRSIMDTFTEHLVKATKQMKIGDPFAEDTTVGAMIHEQHARKVLGYIQSAKEEGCSVLCGGGRRMLEGQLAGGWYLEPTILTGCTDDMKVVQEEVFGSVLSLLPFDTEAEVVERANNTEFGLAGGVFTRDLQLADRVADALQCGTVWVNDYNQYPPELPFGGYKNSGIGRENGTAVMMALTQLKTKKVNHGDVDCGPLYTTSLGCH